MYTLTPIKSIDFGASGIEATLQSARFVLSTVLGTCFMARSFGWDPPLDQTTESAKSLMSVSIIEALESNIPGIVVESIEFDEGENFTIIPRVKVVFEDGTTF